MYNQLDFDTKDYLDFVFGVQTEQTERLQIARHFNENINGIIEGLELYKSDFNTREAIEKHFKESAEKALARIKPILKKIEHENYLAKNN
jgi:hypothetical protein